MLVRVGGSNDVAEGAMRAFDVAGTKVNVASVSGNTAGIVGAARVTGVPQLNAPEGMRTAAAEHETGLQMVCRADLNRYTPTRVAR